MILPLIKSFGVCSHKVYKALSNLLYLTVIQPFLRNYFDVWVASMGNYFSRNVDPNKADNLVRSFEMV